MKKELEYKYNLCANTYQLLRQLPFLAPAPKEQHLVSYYYDTADFQLMQQGYALRILDYDNQFIQTLKGGGSVEGALHEREEWESIVKSNQVQVDNIPLQSIRQILENAIANDQLLQLFITDFVRHCWEIKRKNTVIELAIDHGVICKGNKKEKIFELEIELILGELSEVDQFRREIEAVIELDIQQKSKAERAYAL